MDAPAVPVGRAELDRRAGELNRRAAMTVPGTAAARRLSLELGELGRACLAEDETGRAVEVLEQACGFDPDNGEALALLTLAYVRSENYESARFYLQLARQRAPRAPPQIYRTLAEVYEALHRLNDAVDAWEEFLRLSGEDSLVLARLVRLQAERALSVSQHVLLRPDFAVYYDDAVGAATAERAAAVLEEAYGVQSAFFGTKLPARQSVILYAGRAYFALASVPDWGSGIFDGKIRVSLEPSAGASAELSGVLAHELAHALVRRASADRAPGWLHEGLAQWCEGRRLTRRDFERLFAGSRPLALEEMDGLFARTLSPSDARRHYAQMLGLVEYLVAARGEGAVACLVQGLSDGSSAESVLQRETGLSGEALVSAWKAWAGLPSDGRRIPP